jgi:signal transduction histidine kinase
VSVRVEDTGRGFDLDAIPVERLGVRTSILRRMEDVGGTATITSSPGHGTVVELEWSEEPTATAGDSRETVEWGA